jgi:hypothetical protein
VPAQPLHAIVQCQVRNKCVKSGPRALAAVTIEAWSGSSKLRH